MNYIAPKSWGNFQHYKDRSPQWIKLHKSILDNYEYQCLPTASKALAPMLWLLASEYEDGKIPADLNRIAFRIRISVAEVEEALSHLIHSGFFICYQDASEVLADCLPREEKSREYKAEKEVEKKKLSSVADATDQCPHQAIIEIYHQTLPTLPRVREWTSARQTFLRNRWKEKPERQTLDWWAGYFAYVAESDFLCGRIESWNGKPPFQADLEWLVKPANLVKVIEGKYENARGAA